MTVKRLFTVTLLAGAAAGFSSTANAVVTLGNPYTPTGANYSITAVQGVDESNPLGKSGFSPQVNHDFEFAGSTGVSYDAGGGKLTNFGIGLYSGSNNLVQSTGLRIDFNEPVSAASIVVTLEDFDIKAGKDTFFNPGKVEPTLVLLGANNVVLGKANPTNIFSALTPTGDKSGDVWNLNFTKVMANLNLADGPVKGFILAADMAAGEKPNSDPYLMIAVGNGIPAVPEPSNYMAGLFGIAIAIISLVRSKKRRTA